MPLTWDDQREWLETDGLGGFASGTVGGIRTRRYHGLLTVARRPPTERFMLVNGIEVTATTPAGAVALSSHRYDGQVVQPDGYKRIARFTSDPWPTWRFSLPNGVTIEQELFLAHDAPVVAIRWRASQPSGPLALGVRPLLCGRDIHALHHENPSFNFDADHGPGWLRWQPYRGVPGVVAHANGKYRHEPLWYRRFFYQEEWLRGFDAMEDIASPGKWSFDLAAGPAVLIMAATDRDKPVRLTGGGERGVLDVYDSLLSAEFDRRAAFPSRLHRAADQYVVRRDTGRSVVAGYPWFADWGRDTFVSMRGLCLSTDRLDVAREILLAWAEYVSDGMLPNRFPDAGEAPEYNAVDAALWYVIAVHEYLDRAESAGVYVPQSTRAALLHTVDQILSGYTRGTRHNIRADDDGLLRAGGPGVQLTWMDAKIGDWVVTPRTGKAVDIQALWLNALHLAATHAPRWAELFGRGRTSFRTRFWNEAAGGLFDVIDVDHDHGRCDGSFRPNQIFAVGGLPLNLLDPEPARRVVDSVEKRLWTPLGLRSLAPDERNYAPRYSGGPRKRDAVYHQGTVWPWLIGPFVEAWVRVRGGTKSAKPEARRRFLAPLIAHLDDAGLGHVSEIADGDAPHMPRGCPFQAWSTAELLRLDVDVLRDDEPVQPPRPRRHPTAIQPAHSR